jgi:hypothetical protein
MSIRVGIYDFFAYTIPGSLYLAIVVYGFVVFGLFEFDVSWLSNLSLVQIIASSILAYIVGLVVDLIAKQWYRLFRPKDFPKDELKRFRKRILH